MRRRKRTKLDSSRRAAHPKTHLLIFLCIGLALAAASGALVAAAAPDAGAATGSRQTTVSKGSRIITKSRVVKTTTGRTPPISAVAAFKGASVAGGAGEVVIPGVPAYEWRDGCAPTAVAMVVGYWDAHGYDDLVPGDAQTQTEAVSQTIASHGSPASPRHYEDYALPMDQNGLALDKSEAPVGDEHVSDSVADFLHTSWSSEGLYYGGTWSSMIPVGFVDYARSKYPIMTPVSNKYSGTALTWALVKGEIDAGRPMVFFVDATADGRSDHAVTVVGYRETNGVPEWACWDTWSVTSLRWSEFRGMSTSYGFGVWGGWTFTMGAATPEPAPTPAPTPTPTPAPTPSPPPAPVVDTAPPVTTAHGADDAWHRTSVTLALSATDDWSGVAYTEFALDGGIWMRGDALTLTLGRKAVNSGVHTVAYRSVDLAGNAEAERYVQVKLDGKTPYTTSSASGSTAVLVDLAPTDAHSGVAVTYYAVDKAGYKAGTSVQVTGKGTHLVKFYSVDVAGNVEVAKSVKVVVR